MVRVAAKRQRATMVVLHISLRAVPQHDPRGVLCAPSHSSGAAAAAASTLLVHQNLPASVYVREVVEAIRAKLQLIGGIRYTTRNALELLSSSWDGNTEEPEKASAPPEERLGVASDTLNAAMDGGTALQTPLERQQSRKRARCAGESKRRRSGVARCVLLLRQSPLHGSDAATTSLLRAACTLVRNIQLTLHPSAAAAGAEGELAATRRQGRKHAEGTTTVRQRCIAAVRVVQVQGVLQ